MLEFELFRNGEPVRVIDAPVYNQDVQYIHMLSEAKDFYSVFKRRPGSHHYGQVAFDFAYDVCVIDA
jgi:hypothetical protein